MSCRNECDGMGPYVVSLLSFGWCKSSYGEITEEQEADVICRRRLNGSGMTESSTGVSGSGVHNARARTEDYSYANICGAGAVRW